MKALNKFSYILLACALVVFTMVANAQVYTATNYYYNNFDGGQLGDGFTKTTTAASLTASNVSPLAGSYSLRSIGATDVAAYQIAGLTAGTNLNNEAFGWEWTLVYKNNGGSTDNSDVVSNNENAWKYWLFANSTNLSTMSGYYLTQNGNTLSLMLKDGNNYRSLCAYNLTNGTTYAIRVQRLKRGSQYVWQLYVDSYSASQKEAFTPRGGLNYEANVYNIYNYAGLQVAASTSGRFQFDELKMYSMQLNISGANNAANGISNPLYASQQNAVLYGIQISTRGLFDIYQFKAELTGNITSIIDENTVKLNKSIDSYFGNADDTWLVNVPKSDVYDAAIQYYGSSSSPFVRYWSVGNNDGSLVAAGYCFITANVLANPSATNTFAFAGSPIIKGANSESNYVETPGTVVSTGTGNSNSGVVKDWTGAGANQDWATAANWSPSGAPGANDLARIGVFSYAGKPNPTVSTAQTIGNIVFGNNVNTATATLTVNANVVLTVNNNIENQAAATLAGAGTIDIKGTLLAKPSATPAKTVTVAINTLNAVNVLLNSATAGVVFNANSINVLVKNVLQTVGSNAATFNLGSSSTLTLTGATPITLGAGINTFTLNTGSTVVYGATINQNISTALSYKNISFSGAGTKDLGNGTLTVSGNWNSAGGKLNLLNGTVSFVGANQTITDSGSDANNGIVFGNLSLSGGNKTLAGSGKFSVAVGRYLTLGANTVLDAADRLTLKASEIGSASVAAIPSTSSVQGRVTVEKYVQGGAKAMWRSYRMLSSPVYDNDNPANRTYTFAQFIDNTLITGKTAGFDQLNNSATSAWTYNNGFVAIPSVNTAVNVGRGAYILYRGDRTNGIAKVTVPYVDPESIVMDFKGTLNQQTVNVPLTHGSTTFSFLGNPYAATIDWTLVQKTANVSATIRTWNPEMKQYATFNGQYGVNGGVRYIGPGQGFFIQTTDASSPSVTFTEACKVSDVPQTVALYNRVMSAKENTFATNFSVAANSIEEVPSQIRIKLRRDGYENEDETLVLLKQNELATLSGYDVERTGGEAVFLSSLSAEGKKMAINYMPHISSTTAVGLDVNMSNSGTYTMSFNLADIPFGYELKLRDKYLNTFTDLSLEGAAYTLTVDTTDPLSMGNRFEILVSPTTTLPVVLTDFNGAKTNQGVLLKWKTSSEVNNSHFIIKRAGEEQIFTTIGNVQPNQAGFYSLLDASPLPGNNYYKLVQVDKSGKETVYNQIVVVKYQLNEVNDQKLLVYPTVVVANFTLKYAGALSSEQYILKIADISGKEIFSEKVSKADVSNGFAGVFPSVSAGIYTVTLIDVSQSKKLGSAKLVKK